MMYCRYCYRMLEDGTEICTACGKSQEKSTINHAVDVIRTALLELFGKSKADNTTPQPAPVAVHHSPPAKQVELTEHEKREIIVSRVSLHDMEQFTLLPFVWNAEVQKVTGPSTQPCAFMDIIGPNIQTARIELEKMNELLLDAHLCTSLLPLSTTIPIEDIVFTPRKRKGYSKIFCTPYTFTGRLSKHPASLHFMTDFIANCDSTHGELVYGQSGEIAKAKVYCWRSGQGFFFHYKTAHGELILDKIVSTILTNDRGLPGTIYTSSTTSQNSKVTPPKQ